MKEEWRPVSGSFPNQIRWFSFRQPDHSQRCTIPLLLDFSGQNKWKHRRSQQRWCHWNNQCSCQLHVIPLPSSMYTHRHTCLYTHAVLCALCFCNFGVSFYHMVPTVLSRSILHTIYKYFRNIKSKNNSNNTKHYAQRVQGSSKRIKSQDYAACHMSKFACFYSRDS